MHFRSAITHCLVAAAIASAALVAPAGATGISQEGSDPLALLYDDHDLTVEAWAAMRRPTNGRTGARNGYGWNGSSSSGPDPSGRTGSLGVHARLGGDGDCMARLHQPWTRWERRDPKWAAANDFAESRMETLSLDAACSWRFDLSGTAQLRIIGGLRAGGMEIYHQLGLPAHLAFHLKSQDVAFGWRAGVSYEDPADGLRASLTYTAPMPFAMSGDQWVNGVRTGSAISAEVEMPRSLALRVEHDLAPRWRGAATADWTEWSAFDSIAISGASLGGQTGTAVFDTGFSDAISLGLEVEHDLTEEWRVGADLRWDQGVSGGVADLWTLGATVGRRIGKHVDLELSAALGWRMSGGASGTDAVTGRSWSYTSEAGPVYGAGVQITFGF